LCDDTKTSTILASGLPWETPCQKDGEDMRITFESPQVVDYGSISAHTFARAQIPITVCIPDPNPNQNKQGDTRVCKLDKFCEYSCPS
jgi:hypothetical protein